MRPQTIAHLDQLTRDAYDEVAEDFATTRKKIWSELEQAVEGLAHGQHVLDLGCGNGRLMDYLSPDIRYTGVDGSSRLLILAHQLATDLQRPDADFILWSPLNGGLSVAPQSVDRIISIAFLHHVPSRKLRREVLDYCARVLKPDGELHLTCWRLWSKRHRNRLVAATLRLPFMGMELGDILIRYTQTNRERRVLRYYHAYRHRELLEDLTAAGFAIKEDLSNARNWVVRASMRNA